MRSDKISDALKFQLDSKYQFPPAWDVFRQKMRRANGVRTESCSIMSALLFDFSSYSYGSENDVDGLLNRALAPLCMMADSELIRYNGSEIRLFPTSCLLAHECILITGEETCRSEYDGGIIPFRHNEFLESLTPWGEWTHWQGSMPYHFAYHALADDSCWVVLGVLDPGTKRFIELQSYNFEVEEERVRFALDLVKLLPVVKGLIGEGRSAKKLIFKTPQESETALYVRTISPCVFESKIRFEILWEFGDLVSLMEFFTRIQHILNLLAPGSMEYEDHAEFTFLRYSAPFYQMTYDESMYELRTCFEPVGFALEFHSARCIASAMLAICKMVIMLHSKNIVQNELAWKNIRTTSDGKVFLLSFDNAVVVSTEKSRKFGIDADVCSLGQLIDRALEENKVVDTA